MAQDTQSVYFEEAVRLFRDKNFEEAYDLLERITDGNPAFIEAQSYLALARNQLLKGYRERLEGSERPLRIAKSPKELIKFNLTNQAGYVLSLVQSNPNLQDVVALSSLDLFDLYRILIRLEGLGIVEIGK